MLYFAFGSNLYQKQMKKRCRDSKYIGCHSLKGYKLKYNINDTYYYMGLDSILPDKCIQRIYPYKIYENENYKVDSIPPRVIYKGDLYIQN